MYKSFVTCDDPKGVVQCGSIRKSKVASMNMEQKPRNRSDKSSNTEQIPRSSFSQNHDQFIDCWSKGLCNEASLSQSKGVAKELLKEALELQDSLAMLGKFQEASHYLSKLKKRKEKLERGRFGEVWCDRTNSYRFMCHDHRISADGSSRDALQKKSKAPNLIAKLMGLEDIPLEPLAQRRHMDVENLRKSGFDVEMHKVRKPPPLPKMVDSQRKKTLQEILETPECQGLIRETSAKEHKSYYCHHQPMEFHSRRKSFDDVHPIFLIKPQHIPCFDTEQGLEPIVLVDGGIDTKMMLRKMRIRQGLCSGSIQVNSKGSRRHFERGQLEDIPTERIIWEGGANVHMKVDFIPEEREVRTINQRLEMARKVEAEKTEERAEKKRRDSSPSKANGSSLAARERLKEKITDKKLDKVQKVLTSSSRKTVERAKNVSKSDDQTKLTSTKLRKPRNGSVMTDEHASQQRATTRKSVAEPTTQTKIYSSKDQKQKEKPAWDNTAAIPVPQIVECKEEQKIDVIFDIHTEKKEPSYVGEMTLISIGNTSYKGENKLKKLLLNSPTFVNLAEELFHLNLSYPKIAPLPEIYARGVTNAKITSDYATEFIERRSLPDSKTRHPLLLCIGCLRIPLSIDQLVEEIHSGIQTLESYHKGDFDKLRGDSFDGILERDMRCEGLVSGVWDSGWRNGFAVDEIEQSVNDLETLLVSELIEEVFSSLM